MLIKRRTFLSGLGAALFAATAIVRASSLMPIRSSPPVAAQNGIYRAISIGPGWIAWVDPYWDERVLIPRIAPARIDGCEIASGDRILVRA